MSQAGATNDGVTLDLAARDAGAQAQLDALMEKLGGVGKSISGVQAAVGKGMALAAMVTMVVKLFKEIEATLSAAEKLGAKFDELGIQGAAAISKIVTPAKTDLQKTLEEIRDMSAKAQTAIEDELNKVRESRTGFHFLEQLKEAVGLSEDMADIQERADRAKAIAAKAAARELREAEERDAAEKAEREKKRLQDLADQEETIRIGMAEGWQRDSMERTKIVFEYQRAAAEAASQAEVQALARVRDAKLAAIDAAVAKQVEQERRANDEAMRRDKERAAASAREQAKFFEDQRRGWDAMRGLWAGYPDFLSASQSDMAMDLLMRIGR